MHRIGKVNMFLILFIDVRALLIGVGVKFDIALYMQASPPS